MPGVPFSSIDDTNAALSAGTASRERTTAKPMRWVKLTLVPVVRTSCSLSAARFTSSNRAGTVRTEVAVGTPRLSSMFATMRPAAPRSAVAPSAALPWSAPGDEDAVADDGVGVGVACGL